MQNDYKVVLIIDDDERLLKAFCRCSKGRFDGLLCAASTPKQAFDKLEDLNGSISHVICDWDLGPDCIKGDRLLSTIRKTHPEIVRGIIWTGSIENVKQYTGIDAVISKSPDFRPLFDALEA